MAMSPPGGCTHRQERGQAQSCRRNCCWSASTTTLRRAGQRDGWSFARRLQAVEATTIPPAQAGQVVVDLGAAPGGWSQVAARRVGSAQGRGKVVAIDLLEMPEIPGVSFVQLDFMDARAPELLRDIIGGGADVVMSDMAANTTGNRKTDQLRIVGLVEAGGRLRRLSC